MILAESMILVLTPHELQPCVISLRANHSSQQDGAFSSPGMSDMSPLDLEDEEWAPVLPQDLSVGIGFVSQENAVLLPEEGTDFVQTKAISVHLPSDLTTYEFKQIQLHFFCVCKDSVGVWW